jgi:hypothetical protein
MTKERRNFYEELIDKMMIEEVVTKEQIRVLLRANKNIKTKRTAILAALEENNKDKTLLFNKIKTLLENTDEKNIDSVEHIKNLVVLLRDYVDYGDTEVKKFGEVMTPISLVEEMLDTLPNEVWSNPDLKWLDPCAGVGVFPSVIVERLMAGLENIIEDEDERYQHILGNMLYVAELQPKNCFLFLCGFDPQDKYDTNVYQGSYLDEGFRKHAEDIWGVDKFDIVVMNPPYQEQKEGFKKTQPLWHKFVIKSIEKNLVENGYLVAVHPSGWRNVSGVFKKTQNLIKSKELIYLEQHTFQDGIKTFGAKTDYDFYCLRNINNNNFITKIKCQDGSVARTNISDDEYIPNGKFKELKKLYAKNGEERVNILYSRSNYGTDKKNVSKEQTEEYKYPCVYTTTTNNKVNFWYSNINNNGHFNIAKVFWSNGYSPTVHVDENGKYGLTQFSYGIVDEVNYLHKIKKALDSPEFKKIMRPVDDGCTHQYNRKVIAMFRKDFWKEFI